MNSNLFTLAWRETVRSAYWGKSLATNIGLGFLALYFSASFLVLGFEQVQQHFAGVFWYRSDYSSTDAKVADR